MRYRPVVHGRCLRAATAAIVALAGCKAAREYAEKKYDERRAEERAQERDAEARATRQEAERPPVPALHGPGVPAGRYRITAVRVAAFATDRKDRPWDTAPGELPDLEVRIAIDGAAVGGCKFEDDRAVGRCALDLEVDLPAGATITLDVRDRDNLVDDPMGRATLAEPGTWDLGVELPMVPAGRILSASITIAPIPTWWDLHRHRMLGLGAGIGLALGVVGLFRRSLLPPPPPRPRCAHCQALLREQIGKCPECGAVQKDDHA